MPKTVLVLMDPTPRTGLVFPGERSSNSHVARRNAAAAQSAKNHDRQPNIATAGAITAVRMLPDNFEAASTAAFVIARRRSCTAATTAKKAGMKIEAKQPRALLAGF
jgi:hypothetical protein